MRFAITLVLSLVFYGFGRYAQARLGLPTIIVAVFFTVTGFLLQLVYARLVNLSFKANGMSEWERNRLRNDSGVVPFGVGAVGFSARAALVAGTLLPLMHVMGWLR